MPPSVPLGVEARGRDGVTERTPTTTKTIARDQERVRAFRALVQLTQEDLARGAPADAAHGST
jgi:hypothetical protein